MEILRILRRASGFSSAVGVDESREGGIGEDPYIHVSAVELASPATRTRNSRASGRGNNGILEPAKSRAN